MDHMKIVATVLLVIGAIVLYKAFSPSQPQVVEKIVYVNPAPQGTPQPASILPATTSSGSSISDGSIRVPAQKMWTDTGIEQAVINNTKVKCAFYIENSDERQKVIRMLGYGGNLNEREVSYALSTQKKQYAVIRVGKSSPSVIQIHDTPDAKGDVNAYLDYLFTSDNYVTTVEVLKDYDQRYTQTNTPRVKSRKASNAKAVVPPSVPGGSGKGSVQTANVPPGKNAGGGPIKI